MFKQALKAISFKVVDIEEVLHVITYISLNIKYSKYEITYSKYALNNISITIDRIEIPNEMHMFCFVSI